jgi:3-oxoacyl-[acyl-carrier protein] reductase
MNMLLKNKNALITGAGAGIGRSIALAMAREGANVCIADINLQAAESAAAEISGLGVKSAAYKLDISEVDKLGGFVEDVESSFGRIDILVNNAGVTSTTRLLEMTPQEWDRIMNINCRGTFFLSQAVFARMLDRKSGRIINLGSISGERGAKYAGAHYSVSKAGVIMMTKVFAKYAADSGVTINTVSPGIIATEMTERLGTQINPEDVPMNRMGTQEEVAQAVIFLASDMSGYITGQNISVNGGQSMR